MIFCLVVGENLQRPSPDSNYGYMFHMIVRIADYQLGHAPLLESLLEMNVSECIYKDNG
jgi:hypothetical protein